MYWSYITNLFCIQVLDIWIGYVGIYNIWMTIVLVIKCMVYFIVKWTFTARVLIIFVRVHAFNYYLLRVIACSNIYMQYDITWYKCVHDAIPFIWTMKLQLLNETNKFHITIVHEYPKVIHVLWNLYINVYNNFCFTFSNVKWCLMSLVDC